MRDLELATGVSRETIRYYIREGLLPEPDRPSRNVAWYDDSFVERIALIKELQSKRYLPLQVIKAVLDSGADFAGAEAEALRALDGRVFPPASLADAQLDAQLIATVAERTGLPVAEIEKLAEVGTIEISGTGADAKLDPGDLEIVEAWAALRNAGFSAELGFDPENLRVHVGMVSLLIDEELRIFARRITGRLDPDHAARMAEAGIEQIGRIIVAMRRKRILESFAAMGLERTRARRTG